MSQHYNRWTLEDTAFCKTCNTRTQHKVSGGRLSYCIPCFDKRQEKEAIRKAEEAANPVFDFAQVSA